MKPRYATENHIHNREPKPAPLTPRLAVIALCMLLGALSAHAQDAVRLPDIGTSARAIVSEQDEQRYGRALVRELHRIAQVIDDPLVAGYMGHLGYRLAAFSDEPERDFTFLVLDADPVNAFAAPGGVIAIHSGLMLLAENEAELAGVVAHEIAHVTQRHLARAVENQQKVTIPMMLLMLGAAVAAGGSGDAVQAAVVGGQGLMQQMLINFTRANEYEADRIGIRTLAKAGFSPQGMAEFFGKMAIVSRNYGGQGVPEFLRTHPVETTRIAEAKGRAESVTVINNPDYDPDYFMLIRERVRVMTADTAQELAAHYADREARRETTPADRYGQALAHIEAHELIKAVEVLEDLQRDLPDSLPVSLAIAEAEEKAGLTPQADTRFADLNDRYPYNLPVVSAYAEALLTRGTKADVKQAETMLRPLLTRFPENAGLFALYARAAESAGQWVRAEEAYAQQVFLLGQVYDAVSQLEKLIKKPELDYYQRSRIEARLNDYRPILAEIQREDGFDPSEQRRERRRDVH
ncbi:MAG: M48 family metalloprotease [Lysobacterales bacterium]